MAEVAGERPGPDGSAGAAGYVAALNRLKNWTGVSFRTLERRAAQSGEVLPRTTITNALGRDRLPSADLVAVFVRACGGTDAEVEAWLDVRRALAVAPSAEVPARREGPAAESPPPVYVPVILGRPRRGVLVALAAATAVGTAAGILGVAFLKSTAGEPARAENDRVPPTRSAPASAPAAPPQVTAVEKAVPPTARQLRRVPEGPDDAPHVVYIGDSVGVETSNALAYFVHESRTAKVLPAVRPGADLCDFLKGGPKVPGTVHDIVLISRPKVVVLQFWGRDGDRPACGADLKGARAAERQITRAAAKARIPRPKVVWVLQAPDKADRERVRRLNESVYQVVADDHGDVTADAGAPVSKHADPYEQVADSRYEWIRYVACDGLERAAPGYCPDQVTFGGLITLHQVYDDVHFCLQVTPDHRCVVVSPGAVRYARAIAVTTVRALVT
ncbi:hypothetical protein [Actinocorallia longicatena]|uniref:Helix-turn-helix protein n=1 Tax=Actinocorallia longicatena TaxID=111803 RepID=A0ABP6Q328_9ACTN